MGDTIQNEDRRLLDSVGHLLTLHRTPALLCDAGAREVLDANYPAKQNLFSNSKASLPLPVDDIIDSDEALRAIQRVLESVSPRNRPSARSFGIRSDSGSLPRHVYAQVIETRQPELLPVVVVLRDPAYGKRFLKRRSENMSNLSHTIRSCLTTIQGFSELLIHRSFEMSQVEKYLGFINDQAIKLAKLMEDLEAVVHHEGGRDLRLVLEEHILSKVVMAAVVRARSEFANREISVDIDSKLSTCFVQEERVAEAIYKILDNALRYTDGPAAVRARPRDGEGVCEITVKDRGPGMDAAEMEKAFDPFFRGANAPRSDAHLGNGLPVARHIVESHGGEILMKSSQNGGTCITFTLPTRRPVD